MPELVYSVISCISIGVTFSFGCCFFFLAIPPIPALHSYRNARRIMAVSYVILAALYILELIIHIGEPDIEVSQTTKIIVAAFQAFLFTYTLISLIDVRFVTKRKILFESIPIIILSILLTSLFPEPNGLPFNIVFYTCVLYYLTMLARYTYIFVKEYHRYICKVENFFSEDETARLRWIRYSFFVALGIGIAALMVSFCETRICHTLFILVFVCFYIYFGIKFIDYALIFGEIEPVVFTDDSPIEADDRDSAYADDMTEKIEQWIAQKGFSDKGTTIEQLAKALSTNRTYLSKHINTAFGKSFNEWINDLRINEACLLLLSQGKPSIGEVSEKVGYANQSHFTREFSKRMGHSPKKWRELQV